MKLLIVTTIALGTAMFLAAGTQNIGLGLSLFIFAQVAYMACRIGLGVLALVQRPQQAQRRVIHRVR